jgi:hypothetical protein
MIQKSKREYHVKTSNRFVAMENLDDDERENIKASATEEECSKLLDQRKQTKLCNGCRIQAKQNVKSLPM